MDFIINRCPLFCDELHTSPDKSMAVDTLHTFNYGPVMWWTSSALWRLIMANPWQLRGSGREHTLELACRRMRADMFEFFERKGIPAARRAWGFHTHNDWYTIELPDGAHSTASSRVWGEHKHSSDSNCG